VETAHCGEVGGEAFGVSGLKLLDEELDVLGDDLFSGLRLGCGREDVTLSVVALLSFEIARPGPYAA